MNRNRVVLGMGIAVALMIGAIACSAQKPVPPGQQEEKAKDAISVILSRKSVRHFTGEAVSKEQLEMLLRAGMAAPTAMNKQPWSFVVVTDRSKLDALREGLPSAAMLEKAGAAVVVCAVPGEAMDGRTEMALLDATLASENILLAAEAMGLGAVWTAISPDGSRMGFLRKTLGIPETVVPLNLIPIGRPTGVDKPKDKFVPGKIHWGQW